MIWQNQRLHFYAYLSRFHDKNEKIVSKSQIFGPQMMGRLYVSRTVHSPQEPDIFGTPQNI